MTTKKWVEITDPFQLQLWNALLNYSNQASTFYCTPSKAPKKEYDSNFTKMMNARNKLEALIRKAKAKEQK